MGKVLQILGMLGLDDVCLIENSAFIFQLLSVLLHLVMEELDVGVGLLDRCIQSYQLLPELLRPK